MATTKIFSITTTEAKALAYISNPSKTENGRFLDTFGCSSDPDKAAEEFADIRQMGTGRSTVLCQHFIASFMPGEITPEKAFEVGKQLCEKMLHDEYQYMLAVHVDKEHIHLHCIFNNTNMIDGLTFETHENQGKINERKWKILRENSDELCLENGLSVIRNPEQGKGKSHYEWDMNRQGLSWKAKLKYAIDRAVKDSENFEDFLQKCSENGVLVNYDPTHKIDLKFMLEEQKINNPKAKFTRAKTLGWYYETEQIKRRIDMYNGIVKHPKRTKIIRTDTTKMQGSYGLKKWADIQNMKEASKVINILTKYGVEDNVDLENKALTDFAKMAALSEELNSLNTRIEDLSLKIKTAETYVKFKPFADEMKTLDGRKKDKFAKVHADKISKFKKAKDMLFQMFPDGRTLSPESMSKKRNALIKERSEKNEEYKQLKSRVNELNYARQSLNEYIRNERDVLQHKRKKGDLE